MWIFVSLQAKIYVLNKYELNTCQKGGLYKLLIFCTLDLLSSDPNGITWGGF